MPYLPVKEWSAAFIDWLNANLEPFFDVVAALIRAVFFPIEFILTGAPPIVIIALFAALGIFIGGWRLGAFVLAALGTVSAMALFAAAMQTLSLAAAAALFSIGFGIPLGIALAHIPRLRHFVNPMLDFMQTMPLFVYLIPAVLFFHIGNIPGIVATFIFAAPPAVRLTALGIEQIDEELREAGQAFGASFWQMLAKIELPLALPSIMAGVNQVIMLSLSMVVVASMIGAEGLGQEVLRGITRLNVGQGIAGGVALVLLAMVLDRLTKGFWKRA